MVGLWDRLLLGTLLYEILRMEEILHQLVDGLSRYKIPLHIYRVS